MSLKVRLPILILGMFSLIAGIWSGLLRLGLELPAPGAGLAAYHGPLMVCGFLGTVIGLERAVATGWRSAYIAPPLAGAGALTAMAFPENATGPALVTASSLFVFLFFLVQLKAHFNSFMVTMAAGAGAWLLGNVMWLSGALIYDFVLWWAAFLALTIAGERLELSRFRGHSQWALALFAAAAFVFTAGVAWHSVAGAPGVRLAGAGMALMSVWFLKYDIAMITVRQPGLTRFVAVCLISGYAWFFISGLLGLSTGELASGAAYDALLHGVFVGFVFSMIFGHAPIIFPAVTGFRMIYSPLFYVHLALLHVSLLLRVGADIAGWEGGTVAGGALNAAAIALFLVNTVASIIRGRTKAGSISV